MQLANHMDDLRARTALVTGSSRGIGRAIAEELARAGADMIIHYRTRHAEALEAARDGRVVQADVSSAADMPRLAREAGAVDILVNNAGIAPALIDTQMVSSNPHATAERIPVGRFGQADEVASAAVLLARNGIFRGKRFR